MNLNTTNTTKPTPMSQMLVLFAIVWAGGITVSDEQVASITQILLSPLFPIQGVRGDGIICPVETVRGMSELAQLLGVSIPTANKLSQSGIFDAARLNFGTKKFVWDKAKLMEIAHNRKK